MTKKAFLFPGQGAQVVGMGRQIAEAFPKAARIYNRADQILSLPLSRFCFEGPLEKLNSTEISQPAIFTTSAAILQVLKTRFSQRPIEPDFTAGLSLGEYTALYASGVIDFHDALLLCARRGRAMQQASDVAKGAMVSIIGLDEQNVSRICSEAAENEVLKPVNFNCPGQIVVSGGENACRRAKDLADRYGAIKAVQLDVAGAFHTEMMASAAESLEKTLKNTKIGEPSRPKIIANVDAEYYTSAEKIRQGLINQLTCPILWQKCMEKLLEDGAQIFYEIGPGRVITGLMRRINRKAKVINLSNFETLNGFLNTQ